jgi:hypothetical protein
MLHCTHFAAHQLELAGATQASTLRLNSLPCHILPCKNVSFVACELTAANSMSGASAKNGDAFQASLGVVFP